MKTLRSRYIILICLAFFMFSCGKLFRKTWFESPPDGLIAIDHGIEAREGTAVRLKHSFPQQVEIQRRGYKTHYGVWFANKANYWSFIEVIVLPVSAGTAGHISGEGFGFGLLMSWSVILAGLIDLANGPINELTYDNYLVKLPDYSEAQSHVKVMEVDFAFDVIEEYQDSTATWMNDFCEEVGFTDEDDLNISGYGDYHIYSEVVSYHVNETKMRRTKRSYKELSLGVNYTIIDKFGKELVDTTIVSQSGQFLDSYEETYPYRDALDFSMLALLSDSKVRRILLNEQSTSASSDYLQPSAQKKNLNYDDLNNAIYKVQTEYGFAPLIPISQDGVAALSHHAYDLVDSLVILSPLGDTIKNYEVIEESFTQDYVLVKINESFESFFSVNATGELSTDAMARFEIVSVGFNQYIDVLNAIEGKVNGERFEDNYTIYQLDLNVSDLLYPAIFSKEGQLLGFVSKTIDTRTVEGVSFFRPLIE